MVGGILSPFTSSRKRKGLKTGFVLLLIITASIAYAQPYPSNNGWFQVDQKKGCAPFTVQVTNLLAGQCNGGPSDPPGTYSNCQMYYIGTTGPFVQNVFTYTYTTPGTYRLLVNYPSIKEDYIDITVVENTPPSFEIYTCSANRVSIKITDNKYTNYATDYNGDGVSESGLATSQFTYGGPGNYNISVRGINANAADNCTANTQPFTAIAALPTPTITTLTAVDAGTLKLDFPAQPNMQLRSEIAVNNATTFQQYQSLYGLSTTTMTSLKVDDNYYCFRLNNYDPCSNQGTPSTVVCSQNVDLTIENSVNKLNWVTSPSGIQTIDVVRNKSPYINNLPGTTTSQDDIDIICKTNYCYQLVSNYTGGAKSISLEKCGYAVTKITPPQINNVSSVVGNPQGVELNWLVDPTINTPEFNVFRSVSGGAYVLISTTKEPKLQDADYKPGESSCYRINYTDGCGNISLSGDPVCPIHLSGSLGAKNIADVAWDNYNGWINGVDHYVLEKYSTSGQLLGSVDLGTGVSYKDDPIDPVNQVIRYIIKAYANDTGNTLSSSNYIEIAKNTNLFSPTAFTPNGDNLNDNFVVIGYYISKLKLTIFDRWGAMVFTTDNNEPWNGNRTGSGIPMPTGTYVWKAELTDFAGKTLTEEGTVLLIRKNN